MNIFQHKFTREFTLLLCQVWGRGYCSLAGYQSQAIPRNVFIIRHGLVKNYRNLLAMREIEEWFAQKSQQSRGFIATFCRRGFVQYKRLAKRSKTPYLTRRELLKFADEAAAFWVVIYASNHLPLGTKLRIHERQTLLKLRAATQDIVDEVDALFRRSLARIFPQFGSLIGYISWEELKRVSVVLRILRKREQGIVSVVIDDKLESPASLLHWQRQHKFRLEQEAKISDNAKALTGQVAYPGVVRGVVQQVVRRADVQTFPKGAVLVSTMTVPDFLPAMKRAVAFVTDEGGITCHAAIIARELRVPCITGTRYATKVLKNGSRVVVDARHGVVRVEKAGRL